MTAAVLRGDTKAQVESLCQGISNGLYTPNEARRMLDLPALEGGDRIYFNGSNIAVEDAGAQYQALPSTTEETEENGGEKAFLYLAKTIESAIISLKGDDYSTRNERGQFTGSVPHGGGSSGNQSNNNSSGNGIPVDSNGVPYRRPQLWLPKDEYAHVMGTISTHYDSKFKGKSIGMIELEFNDQWAWYRFEIHGFNEYNIFDKEE